MTNHPSHFSEPSEAVKDVYGDAFDSAIWKQIDDFKSDLPEMIAEWSWPSCRDEIKQIARDDDNLVQKFVAEMYRRVMAETKS